VTVYTRNAKDGLLLVDLLKSTALELPLGLVETAYCVMQRVSESKFVVLGSEATTPTALYLVDISKPASKILLKSSATIPLPLSVYSTPQNVTFPRTQGDNPEGVAHAIFFAPHNPSFLPLPDTKPPVIVSVHGGPTLHSGFGLNLSVQYWTSRGYAFVLLNHSGSTGYGRLYQDELNGLFGIKDIDEAASCVQYLTETGLVDGAKAGIVGRSSGGYTVLNSLVRYPKVWAAGNSIAGVSDMRSMDDMMHQSGSQYLSRLLFQEGATEEEKDRVYWERSPCFHAEKIESPLLLLQGRDDAAVAVDQAINMAKIMEERGKYAKLVVFDGEGHVFRKKETKITAIEEEAALWKKVLL
jgi:dipeptidyl aminopeptidase/acylaminoacyl peptidase